ncbi:MAG: N-acetyltransferase [Rubrivivax sp.]|nr:MAG: N-acetyltransferase [Rubrivivax sp.]
MTSSSRVACVSAELSLVSGTRLMKTSSSGGRVGRRSISGRNRLLSGRMHILDTERLSLREFTPLDAPFLLRLVNEPGWIRNISNPGLRTLDDALVWAEGRLFKPYRELGHGFWAVERRADGLLVGMCGLFRRAALPEPDIGYALLAEHEGCGYALEAARGCVAHAHDVLGWRTLMAITAVDNPRSVALLSRLGFVEQGQERLEGYNEPSRVFRLTL